LIRLKTTTLPLFPKYSLQMLFAIRQKGILHGPLAEMPSIYLGSPKAAQYIKLGIFGNNEHYMRFTTIMTSAHKVNRSAMKVTKPFI